MKPDNSIPSSQPSALLHILSQINPIHTLELYFFKIHFSIVHFKNVFWKQKLQLHKKCKELTTKPRLTLLLDPVPNCEAHLCLSILALSESVHLIRQLQFSCYPYQSNRYYELPNPQPYLRTFTAYEYSGFPIQGI